MTMTPKQALAWIEKHDAHVARNRTATLGPRWICYFGDVAARGGDTFVEAVEKARDAITKQFVVQSSNDDSGESPVFPPLPSGRARARGEVARRRSWHPHSVHVIVRIVRKVRR
jgi:hypothetical protein